MAAGRTPLNKHDARQQLINLCSEDLLFFINTFAWTLDPRLQGSPAVPFITYEGFQDDALLAIQESVENGHDLIIEKSRDMGASWMILTVFLWFWLFRPYQLFLLVSRKEEYVYKTGDHKALFTKLQFLLEYLPFWMVPDHDFYASMSLQNHDNGSVIDGEATTGDVGAGDRRTAIMMDEFARVTDGHLHLASTRDVTKCRIFNSTHVGTATAFNDLCRKNEIPKLRMHWSSHPVKRAGLYMAHMGRLDILDQTYGFPENYDFIMDGKMRSPWYDEQCRRAHSDAEIAQELDIDPVASGSPFFHIPTIDRLTSDEGTACPPYLKGDLVWDRETFEATFVPNTLGKLKLWIFPNERTGKPPRSDEYSIGCDIATGKGGDGSTNSTASVVSRRTGEKVASLATPNLEPYEFARYVVALGRFFCGQSKEAYLVWEDNGPGAQFGKNIIESGYGNYFFRGEEQAITKRKSKKPGWWSGTEEKKLLLGEYNKALREGEFINREKEALDECREYVHTTTGAVEHAGGQRSIDPSAAGRNHGDRVIADALAWRGVKDRVSTEPSVNSKSVSKSPPGSVGFRRRENQQLIAAKTEW